MPFSDCIYAATETFEKVATIGVVANLTVYLVKRFNIGQIEAANITNIFFGTLNFAPLLGAFISDVYLGRFKTLAYGCFASLLVCPYDDQTISLSSFISPAWQQKEMQGHLSLSNKASPNE